jgi:microcin C transport system ATP-binding protein
MIAMAIANNPTLLIADEPTTALDVTIQAQILALIKSLQIKFGMSVLLITHDLTVVRKIADRVAMMTQGKIVEVNKTSEIFAHPKHEYTKRLLAAEPKNAPEAIHEKRPVVMQCNNLSVSFEDKQGLFAWKKSYKNVLSDIALSVPVGTTLGIVGESGSGKTTLALALLRLIKSKGEIYFSDERIDIIPGSLLRKKRRNMQIVFQDPYSSLNPRLTISDIVREGLDVHEADSPLREREKKVDKILLEVGLSPEVKQRYPHEFSGGQRQRISIARALILNPRLIILDEPTSALDISVQAQILALLRSLQDKYNISYIFISHDLRTIRAMSHHIMVLQKGRIVESASAKEIFSAPKQNYTRTLLAAAL